MLSAAVTARFWAKVKIGALDECWLWTASKDRKGYGKFSLRHGTLRSAHRISFELRNGPIDGDLCVLHRCDTPACVNPDHLFLGTQLENLADMRAKGRDARGIRTGKAKITGQDVLEIRRLVAAGEKKTSVAARFGISSSNVRKIAKGLGWAHIIEQRSA